MARDQSHPITDDNLESARESIREQRAEIREYLEDEGVDVSNWGADSYETDPDVDHDSADSD